MVDKRWSDIVQDYNPVRPVPRWGQGKPVHAGLAAAIERARPTYEAVIDDIDEHREALYAVADADPEGRRPCWNNIWFSCLDAASLVGLILSRRPQRYIEIGSGYSTLFARHAVTWGGLSTRVTSIDPRPQAAIDAICDEVIRRPLEDCAPDLFAALQPGDMLFLDGSHRVFTNSDTTVFFFDILPRLPPGVLVHLHDIFLPADYPAAWNGRLYSEQYLLGAMLLCGAPPFRPVLPCYFVSTDERLAARVQGIFRGRPGAPIPFSYNNDAKIPGVSFWLETVGNTTGSEPAGVPPEMTKEAAAMAELARRTEGRLRLVDVGGAGGVQPKWQAQAARVFPVLFEPNPTEAAKLRDGLLGGFRDGLVLETGLSNVAGPHDLTLTRWWGCASLRKPNPDVLSKYRIGPIFTVTGNVPVTCARYDALFQAGQVPAPDAIKIDVQGFEYEVLQGFGGLLQDCLSIELEAHFYPLYQGQKLLHDLVGFLADFDFVLRAVRPVPSFDGDVVEVDAWFTKGRQAWQRMDAATREKFRLICEVCELIDYSRIDPASHHNQLSPA